MTRSRTSNGCGAASAFALNASVAAKINLMAYSSRGNEEDTWSPRAAKGAAHYGIYALIRLWSAPARSDLPAAQYRLRRSNRHIGLRSAGCPGQWDFPDDAVSRPG